MRQILLPRCNKGGYVCIYRTLSPYATWRAVICDIEKPPADWRHTEEGRRRYRELIERLDRKSTEKLLKQLFEDDK